MVFSRQEFWSGLPFPFPMDHILLQLSIMTRLSWVALHDMAHSFVELDKVVVHVIRLVIFLWLWFCQSVLWWRRIRGLWKLPDGRVWLRGKLGLVLMGVAILSKSLIPFSVDGWGCVPWGQTIVEVMKTMGPPSCTATLSVLDPAAGYHWPTPPPETPEHSQARLGQSIV